MENKILEQILAEIKEMKEGIEDLSQGQERLEKDVGEIKIEVKAISNKLDNLEAKNADRHITLESKIDKLAKDMIAVEAVTAKNWNDIATLRIVK